MTNEQPILYELTVSLPPLVVSGAFQIIFEVKGSNLPSCGAYMLIE